MLDWMGLPVHCHFRTMVIQNENGKYRLKLEFTGLTTKVLDQYLKISPPPQFGLRFDRHEFRDEKRRAFEALAGLIERIVDPQPNVVSLPDANPKKRSGKKSA